MSLYEMMYFSESMDCIVNTSHGGLRGQECTTFNGKKYYSFEGIPYAKPPVGKLRFRNPEPSEPWQGIRDATKPGNKCAQMDPYGKTALTGSEDCLYLNIYTPVLPQEKIQKLPVLFFVHGGRFLVGCGDYYRPDYFIHNDVVLVTVNYRLHVLGFLCLHLPEAPGNAACKDTIMALRWVKKNVAFFNGDENNITAFGESAGAGLVSSYITSKMAHGLVHKVIAQSGVSFSDLFLIEEDPIEKGFKIASVLGKELPDVKSLHKFLLELPIEDLVFATSVAELSRPPHIINAYFLSTIEKKFDNIENFFVEYPLKTFQGKRHNNLPLLLGLSSYEGALFLRKNSEGNIEYIPDLEKYVPRYFTSVHTEEKSKTLAKKLNDFYFKNQEIGEKTKREYLDFLSDAFFNRDIIHFAEYYSKICPNVYLYHFCYNGNMNTRTLKKLGLKGASHGDIIPYEFYRQSKAEQCSKKDGEIVKFITEAWSNFARNGKPTWSNQPFEWIPYNQDKRLCINIDDKLTLEQHPFWYRIKFWLDNMGERSKL